MNFPRSRIVRWGAVLACLACIMLLAAPTWAAHVLYDNQGRRLEVQIGPEFSQPAREQVTAWTEQLAHSLTLVYGHWPRERWLIEVAAASGSSDDPIPWAQVSRGKVDRVTFYVVRNPDTGALLREWTGYHEIAHLLLPYRGWGDTWFSEGLATYYQNLLQARAGLISEQQMWQRLYEGFVRGRNDTRFDGSTLLEVNRQMRSQGGYMRVYWSGAWYFLAADIQLRERSNGRRSLDDALLKLNQCCARNALSVPEIIRKMDADDQAGMFHELYERLRNSRTLPDVTPLFASLGIAVLNGRVQLQAEGAAAERRQQFLRSTVL